jgi:phosphoribosylformylglycinamidine synthase
MDLEEEYALQQVIKQLIKDGLIESAHDVSDGGLFITLLESGMPNGLGFRIETDEEIRKDAFLFGESQSRVVVSVSAEKLDAFVEMMADTDVDFVNLGEVTADDIIIDDQAYGSIIEYKEAYDNAIGKMMEA